MDGRRAFRRRGGQCPRATTPFASLEQSTVGLVGCLSNRPTAQVRYASHGPATGRRVPTTNRTPPRPTVTGERLPAMDRHSQRGFTLFELMLSIALMAVLMAVAVPSFRQYTANTRTSAATNGL